MQSKGRWVTPKRPDASIPPVHSKDDPAILRHPQPEPLMRRALEIFRDSLGEDHPHTRTVVGNYRALQEKLEEAEGES